MGWWHRQPRRWARELADLERCFPRLRLLELGEERRALEGFVRVGEVQRFIRLLWPDTYPHQPPWLIEAEPFTDSPTSTETQLVRFRDGALCLFTHDDSADAWTPERDTVEVIQRYRDFRDADEHDIIGEQADAAVCLLRVTLRIPPGLAQLTRVPGGHGVLLTRTRADLHAWLVVHATCVSPPLPPLTWAHAPRWERALARPDLRPLPWACVTLERVTWSDALPDAAALQSLLQAQLPPVEAEALNRAPMLVLSRAEGADADLLLLVRGEAGALSGSAPAIVEDPHAQLFLRVDGVLSGRARLSGSQVVMVGLGSLGSAVAVELACAGVGRFLLLDGERLGPENVCRHAAALPHLDAPKVQAVSDLIAVRNPDAEVRAFDRGLFWDVDAMAPEAGRALREALADPLSVVVTTTATHGLEQAVNQACVEAGRASVFGAVLGEAEFGRVFRVRPGVSPCYRCVLEQQRVHPGRFPRLPATLGSPRPGQGAYMQPGIPGIGLDVRQVALLVARMTLATLLDGEVDAPQVPGEHLLWSNRAGWIFDAPMALQIEPYERLPECPVCGDARQGDLSPEEEESLAGLEARMRAAERMAPAVTLSWEE